jgi:hypothetical protein
MVENLYIEILQAISSNVRPLGAICLGFLVVICLSTRMMGYIEIS